MPAWMRVVLESDAFVLIFWALFAAASAFGGSTFRRQGGEVEAGIRCNLAVLGWGLGAAGLFALLILAFTPPWKWL